MSHAESLAPEPPRRSSPRPNAAWNVERLAAAIRSAGPPLLFGLRLWASVCLALYVAFWLQLDDAYWAGGTAAIVCQPSLGASLRKGAFRMVGTVIGAVAIVILTACFPQDRTGFLVGLALWGAACGLVATILRNFAAYAAALAGYTAAIIASAELGATGGTSGEAFTLAVTRASEILIGIVCAGIVLVATDFGGARRRLAGQFAALSSEIAGRLAGSFRLSGPEQAQTREARRDLIRRVIALDPVIDEAIGESSDLRYRSRLLQAAVEGLFAALSGWRTVANHLEQLPGGSGPAAIGNHPAEPPAGAAFGAGASRPGDLEDGAVAPAPGMHRGGAGADLPAGPDAIGATARRPHGRGAARLVARAQRLGFAGR